MGLFNFLTRKKSSDRISTDEEFWNWFQEHAPGFYQAVKNNNGENDSLVHKITPRLHELDEGYFFLVGMLDDDTAELVLSVDGNAGKIALIERLAAAAPEISNWKVTALKPAMENANFSIKMNDFSFNKENILFFPNIRDQYPDEVDLTFVYTDYDEHNPKTAKTGVYVFLDNFLGELAFSTTIDNLEVVGPSDEHSNLIPVEKLKEYLNWRQKELVEKYEGTRRDTENDTHTVLKAKSQIGKPLVAIINQELLNWDAKASHPWFTIVRIPYKAGSDGMPDKQTLALLDELEEDFSQYLKDSEGYLNLGRETTDGLREIYFACKEFRKPAFILSDAAIRYATSCKIEYTIYLDKYWQTMNRFKTV